MDFEIEFYCTDIRPLFPKKEKDLVEFLRPLHEKDLIIRLPQEQKVHKEGDETKVRIPFFLNIGILNTKKNALRTFFRARNSIKFPSFVEHRFKIKPDCVLIRRNHFRRHFSVETYGVINRLRIGCEFQIQNNLQIESAISIKQKQAYELICFLLNIDCRIKEKKGELFRLGPSIAEIILNSTLYNSKNQTDYSKGGNVNYVGAIATIICTKEEINTFPLNTIPFPIEACPAGVVISYYDFEIDKGADSIRLYFIVHNDDYSNHDLYRLKNYLIDLRVNFHCVENMMEKLDLSESIQITFAFIMREKINNILKNKKFESLNLGIQDEGEIFEYKRRIFIREWIQEVTKMKML